jgi:predicted flap endonuclease-1-like 5' DNA nuclease
MAYKITTIESIGPVTAEKLEKAGVTTTEGLLEKAASRSGRKTVAEASGLTEGKILDFVNMADMMRIKGVGGEFAELLKASGVDTVKELRTRNAENLCAKMNEVNEEKKLTRRVPTANQLQEFIDLAKDTEPMVTH